MPITILPIFYGTAERSDLAGVPADIGRVVREAAIVHRAEDSTV